jgi:magnesium chelatase subunit I
LKNIQTLGQLKASGYVPKSVKTEMRDNLIKKLKNKEKVFDSILGFDDTVLPDIERAVLSGHNIILTWAERSGENKDCQIADHTAG